MANVNYQVLIDKLLGLNIYFPFMGGISPSMLSATTVNINASPNTRYSGATVDQWYQFAGVITGHTNDKLNDVKSYDEDNRYIPNFDIEQEDYINYLNNPVDGRTRVVTYSEPIIYALDAEVLFIGTNAQATGIQYHSYSGETYSIFESGTLQIKPRTDVRYVGEGWNATNVELSASTMMEYLLGIVSPPEVQSDLFIERSNTTVMEDHLRLGEIKGLDALLDYGNGYYRVGL